MDHLEDSGRRITQLPDAPNTPTVLTSLSARIVLDSQHILERAKRDLEDPELLLIQADDPDPLEAARMEIWRSAMLGYYEELSSEIEDRVEHDVPTWIEANAPIILAASLENISGSFGSEAEVQGAIQALDDSGMRSVYEEELSRLLLQTWQEIEAMIESRANYYRHA